MAEPPHEDPPKNPGWLQHLRAAFVLFHIVAIILLAIPDAAGPAAKRSAWKNPTVQNELASYAESLSSLGIEMSKDELEDHVWNLAQTWTAWMVAVREPFWLYTEYAGVRQRWRMFVAPHRHPATLHIELEEDGQWRPLYVARSSEYTWRGRQLDHTRARSMLFRYAWREYRGHYRRFAHYVARWAAEDFPRATKVRVRWYGFRTPTPDEVKEDRIPEGEFRQTVEIELEALR